MKHENGNDPSVSMARKGCRRVERQKMYLSCMTLARLTIEVGSMRVRITQDLR